MTLTWLGRAALYLGGSPGGMLMLSDEVSGGERAVLPLQLTLADALGGVRGYHGSLWAGARRNVWPEGLYYKSGSGIKAPKHCPRNLGPVPPVNRAVVLRDDL